MWSIPFVRTDIADQIQTIIDDKTKPLGALGMLESLALKLAVIQNSTSKLTLVEPTFWVFAADHGIAEEGVSAYPSEVTAQMVLNFLRGGAAINVFCRQHGIALKVVDAGVASRLDEFSALISCSIAKGTQNFLYADAMSLDQLSQALARAKALILDVAKTGTNIVGFGEMGIANTASASALMALVTGSDVGVCVGRGTGVTDDVLRHKVEVVTAAVSFHRGKTDPYAALCAVGGFEIAMMTGAMLAAAEQRMVILVDGFIASVAALLATKIAPQVFDYLVFCHCSAESGHARLLEIMQARPLLDLNLRLGEGTGAALAYPLIQSAVAFYNEMASFCDAGVSQR